MPSKFVGELKHRILPIFQRRSSDISQHSTSANTASSLQNSPRLATQRSRSKISLSSRHQNLESIDAPIPELAATTPTSESIPSSTVIPNHVATGSLQLAKQPSLESPPTPPISSHSQDKDDLEKPVLTLERPTPEDDKGPVTHVQAREGAVEETSTSRTDPVASSHGVSTSSIGRLPAELGLRTPISAEEDYFGQAVEMPAPVTLPKRVWVKRLGASATLVQIGEDDLVDDVREKILKKYANSLGRTFDSPDVTLRIIPRSDSHGHHERSLGPEEAVAATLIQYYPAGQTIEEALIIDIPHRKTPRHSPRVYMDHHRPSENGGDYFSVMPVALSHSPRLNSTSTMPILAQPPFHSISVLNDGQLPNVPLPSPGAVSRRHGTHRPKYGRTTTSSPTVLTTAASHAGSHADRMPGTPGIAPLPTPPIPTIVPPRINTPPLRAASPRPAKTIKPKKPKKTPTVPSAGTLLDGGVPPISVLIVEDNIINLKLLEAFMKRLKVRWQTAMNGRDAVVKWKTGGFHLVLMDIQLPIMSGLEATREIRRLERVNGIGVLSAQVGDTRDPTDDDSRPEGNDQLQKDQFKSPVIVVALTASSLQSDRHEALAAGCNDFLTKPVSFPWLERKVMEWGCMQALIDFDGWRKWKDFAQNTTPAPTKLVKAAAASSTSTPAKSSSASKSTHLTQESHSDSTSTTGTPPITIVARPPVPDTLIALNDRTDSTDTVGSLDSTNSNDSIETIELSSSRRSPMVPPLTTLTNPSTGSVTTAVPSRGTSSRQSSAASTRSAGSSGYPHSPIRSSTNNLPPPSAVNVSYEERRRKRSSLGRSGLSGVVEELEGVGAS